jgi:plastocyanin
VAVTALAGAAPAAAQHGHGHGHGGGEPVIGEARVSMGLATFAPEHVRVLVGDDVTWVNDSARPHTVTARDGRFDSGRLLTGDTFGRRITDPGALTYVCRLHPGMTGVIEAATLLLDAPAAAASPGRPYPVSGRAALPAGSPVAIADEAGDALATATVGADGRFAATVVPRASTALHATAAGAASPPVSLLVLDRRVTASARRVPGRRTQVRARVTPASAGAKVVLQLRLPLRFGWWPVEQRTLGRASAVTFRTLVRRPVRARVVLTLPDGATVLAATPAFSAGVR